MNIIVCIKQVPASTKVRVDSEAGTFKTDDSEDPIINPFDEYAIEEGLRLREKYEGVVKIVTMGPPRAERAIRTAIAMGADEGYLITDPSFTGADTLATSYTLANAIKKIGEFDLIITGKQTWDGDTAQVGPGVAELLDIPFVAWVRKIEEIKNNTITVERLMESGYDLIQMPLPSLISVVKEINEPRLASLKGIMRSKKTEIKKISADDLDVDKENCGLSGSATFILHAAAPEKRTGGEKISGEIPELVEKISSTILELKLIK